jgi:hypothetical protein
MKILNSYAPAYAAAFNADAQIRFVLTQDAMGSQAVYGGIVKEPIGDQQKTRTDNWIMFHGTKLNYRDAQRHFDISEENYRR